MSGYKEKLSELSKKIVGLASKYSDLSANNLSEMVKIPALSADEERLIAKLKEMCSRAGFDEVRVDGLGNLIARIGSGPRILAIDAHIDTVDTGDLSQWKHPPYSGVVEGGKVIGRGTVDQEGGAASMITAGKILKELDYRGEFTIYFTFTIMEEDCDGLCWNYLIEKEGLKPEFALITEPTNLSIYRGHRGRMEIEAHFKGISAHGSAPERGVNAIYKASKFALGVERLNESLRSDPFLGKGSIAATMIRSTSPSLCAVSDYAMLHLDRRLTFGETKMSALEELKKLSTELNIEAQLLVPVYSVASYKGKLFEQEKYFPTWKLEEAHPLINSAKAAFESLFSKEASVGKWTFSTNGVALSGKHSVPTIGFGPGNEILAHAPNEAVLISDLVAASAFYAMLPFSLEELK